MFHPFISYLSVSIFAFSLWIVFFPNDMHSINLKLFFLIKNLTSAICGVVNQFLSCAIIVMPSKYTSSGHFCFNISTVLSYHDCIPVWSPPRKSPHVIHFVWIAVSTLPAPEHCQEQQKAWLVLVHRSPLPLFHGVQTVSTWYLDRSE